MYNKNRPFDEGAVFVKQKGIGRHMMDNNLIRKGIEVVVTSRTRNAVVGLNRHMGSNPILSATDWAPDRVPFSVAERVARLTSTFLRQQKL